MSVKLSSDQTSTVEVLLGTGKSVKEIHKFTDIDRDAIVGIARSLNIIPKDPAQKAAKELFADSAGHTYADIAEVLRTKGFSNDGEPIHYLTVSTWVNEHGWAWGGAEDGNYAPDRPSASSARSKYTLRMSRTTLDEVNATAQINQAADAAWAALESEATLIVAVGVVKGAAAAGVTDIAAVKAALMDRHGDAIRAAKI